MDEVKRHKRTFKFFYPIMKPVMRLLVNYKADDLSKEEGPYILVSNHNVNLDPVLVGLSTKNQLYFVASEHILRKGFSTWFLNRYFKPIVLSKGKKNARSTIEILRCLKAGNSIGLFAEGNRSFNGTTGRIPESTAKLIKKSGVKLITFKLTGGYFTEPRWGFNLRKGLLRGGPVGIYSPEQIAAMSEDEIYNTISADLKEDAYETIESNPVKYSGGRFSKGLESFIFSCPSCKKIGSLKSSSKGISCVCGYNLKMDRSYILTGSDGMSYTLKELDNIQKRIVSDMIEQRKINLGDEPLFSDNVIIRQISDHKIMNETEGIIKGFYDRINVEGTDYMLSDMHDPAIRSRNTVNIESSDEETMIEITGGKLFCGLKYIYLQRIAKYGSVEQI